MQTIDNYNFKNKRALIRVDFNVPLNDKFEITDDTRMRAAVPTIKKVLAGGGSVILMSHLGRPKNGPEDKFSLKHILKHLEELLGVPVKFADDCIGESAKEQAAALNPAKYSCWKTSVSTKKRRKATKALLKNWLPSATCGSTMHSEPPTALMLRLPLSPSSSRMTNYSVT